MKISLNGFYCQITNRLQEKKSDVPQRIYAFLPYLNMMVK